MPQYIAPQYKTAVPRNPDDVDKTVKAVCDEIIYQTKDGNKLVKVEPRLIQVVLTFEASEG